jgi:hypothetical protein
LSAIEKAADLLMSWSGQVDETHAAPGTIEMMRTVASDVRAEFARLQRSPGAQLDALIKAWALRELEALPRGPWRDWIRQGTPPAALEQALERLPEAVAALVREHVADDLDDCEACRRRAPCRLLSDGAESGERYWRCAWGCPPSEDDPATAAMLREWARECGL